MSKSKGKENELVNKLYDEGFAPMRAPASGAATDRELPDVICGNGSDTYSIEAKSTAKDKVYIDRKEIVDLLFFSANFGSKTRIGVRFNKESWHFFHPSQLHKTSSGNYRVKKGNLSDSLEQVHSL